MDVSKEETQEWLRQVMAHAGETPTSLARRANLATTTLTRFMNDPDSSMLSMRTLTKIAHAIGVPVMQKPGSSDPRRVTAVTNETQIFAPADPPSFLDKAVSALLDASPSQQAWILGNDNLRLSGYLRGDILIVDANSEPEAGQVVCVELSQWERGQVRTVFRVYQHPYVIPAGVDPALWKPLIVDKDQVKIKGTVVAMVRT